MNRHFDFTLNKFTEILDSLMSTGYSFQTMEEFIYNPEGKVVIVRHDVDRSPFNSLQTAKLENKRGIKGTYYFRIVKQSNNSEVIKEIAELGHEIGYHYEDLALAHGVYNYAIESFEANLKYFRTFYPVKTICMHGSPTSRWDNRDLWNNYSYKDFGIIAEPYVDIDYTSMLYITDTGRKWNGEKSSVRDKIQQAGYQSLKGRLKNSDNLIAAIRNKEFPQQILITFHPQRWSDDLFSWTLEYGMQTVKNGIKRVVLVR